MIQSDTETQTGKFVLQKRDIIPIPKNKVAL